MNDWRLWLLGVVLLLVFAAHFACLSEGWARIVVLIWLFVFGAILRYRSIRD